MSAPPQNPAIASPPLLPPEWPASCLTDTHLNSKTSQILACGGTDDWDNDDTMLCSTCHGCSAGLVRRSQWSRCRCTEPPHHQEESNSQTAPPWWADANLPTHCPLQHPVKGNKPNICISVAWNCFVSLIIVKPLILHIQKPDNQHSNQVSQWWAVSTYPQSHNTSK